MKNPWFVTLGRSTITVENREEISAMAFILGPDKFVDEIWRLRRAGKRIPKPRSLSWPKTCRTATGYVLANSPAPAETNVTPIKRRKP
jgi:hypothetical protein